jgi:hypothetical protein
MTTLTSEKRKARKDHNCDACVWLVNSFGHASEIAYELDLTEDEARAVSKAEHNKWQIKKGDEYLFWSGKYDGEICSSHSIPEIDEICAKYDIYDF